MFARDVSPFAGLPFKQNGWEVQYHDKELCPETFLSKAIACQLQDCRLRLSEGFVNVKSAPKVEGQRISPPKLGSVWFILMKEIGLDPL